MHGNHHHQRTDLRGVFTIGPFVPCTPPLQNPKYAMMSICLVKQNDGTWVEKQGFFIQRLQTFFIFVTFYVF